MLQKFGPVELFLDATGGLVKPFGGDFGDKRLLLYTVLVKSPVKNRSAIPIFEMITSYHSQINAFAWLSRIFKT